MLRIPNPVSDPRIFLRVFRDIYGELKELRKFGLDDISRALVATNNVTSQGAIGTMALERSTRKKRSLDPMYNQSKMYSELFRLLGWVQSTSENALTFTFSLLGLHIAEAHDASPLMRECLLGLVYPNHVVEVKGSWNVRIIGTILLLMDSLGSISRDEMMAGPMNLENDSDPKFVSKVVSDILDWRKHPKKLDQRLNEISEIRSIDRCSTMTNYTRFPIGVLRGSGWSDDRPRKPLSVTKEGKAIAEKLSKGTDIRLTDFNKCANEAKPSLIRLGFYKMLERAGFNVDPVRDKMDLAVSVLREHGITIKGDLYFSPFQLLSRTILKQWTPELIPSLGTIDAKGTESASELMAENGEPIIESRSALVFELTEDAAALPKELDVLVNLIRDHLEKAGKSIAEATESLIGLYSKANRDVFYPLVANLFCILGLECRHSRGGQNYERADAMIIDKERSIPIEIKSPGEETEISVKAIRQAFENKVILLSRKSYPTDLFTTSLVVGFNSPNKRSEVHELIKNIQSAFKISVGVIDFRSLVFLAVLTVATGKRLNLHNLNELQGVIRVEDFAAAN